LPTLRGTHRGELRIPRPMMINRMRHPRQPHPHPQTPPPNRPHPPPPTPPPPPPTPPHPPPPPPPPPPRPPPPHPPNVHTPAPPPSATGTTTSGACSTTTCAFVPPNPNDDTPARRGRSTTGQSVGSATTFRPISSKGMCGLGVSKCRFGGMCPRSTA